MLLSHLSLFFFFNDTATTEIYTLSLHDALPISPTPSYDACRSPTAHRGRQRRPPSGRGPPPVGRPFVRAFQWSRCQRDRKSTRLNSSHSQISYAVFCLKKKKKKHRQNSRTK